jgi:hypothetical protein
MQLSLVMSSFFKRAFSAIGRVMNLRIISRLLARLSEYAVAYAGIPA